MSNTIVGILGLLTIVAIVVTLFQSKTQPAIAFIVWQRIRKHRPYSGSVRLLGSILWYNDRCGYV